MLEMRPNCECCNKDVQPNAGDVLICSFECTFCAQCTQARLNGVCPNCGGQLLLRPPRSEALLKDYPGATERTYKPDGC